MFTYTYRRAASLAVSASLLLAGASAVAPAATGDTAGSAFEHSSFQVLDRPTFPSFLVTSGGRGSYVSQSVEGTAVQEYGATGTPDATVLRAWANDQPYGHGGAAAPVAGATSVSLGDLDGDGSVDAAYLIPAADSSRLVVLGSQAEGFPVLASATLPAMNAKAPLRADIFEAATPTGGATIPANVLVTYPSGFAAYDYTSGALRQAAVKVNTNDGLDGITGVVLDVFHRAEWDRHANEEAALGGRSFAYVTSSPGGGVVLHAATFDGTTDRVVNTVADLQVQAQAADAARVRYDWSSRSLDTSSVPPGTFAVTTRTGTTNSVAWTHLTVRDDPYVTRPRVDFGRVSISGTACSGDELATPDVEVFQDGFPGGTPLLACATVQRQSGPDLLVQSRLGVYESEWRRDTRAIADGDLLTRPEPRIELPGVSLLGSLPTNHSQVSTSSGLSTHQGSWRPGTFALGTVVSAGPTGALRPYYAATSYPANKDIVSYAVPVGTATTKDPVLSAQLPPQQRNQISLSVDNGAAPRLVQGKPVPVAFLAAPPQVAGAGQSADAPQFASTASSSTSNGQSTSTRVGAMLGIEYEDPLGMWGAEVEANVSREVTEGHAVTRDVSSSEAFLGLTDDDTVIYTSTQMEEYTGRVVASSTGVGVGTQTVLSLPKAGITSAASVTNLRSRFPAEFGPGGTLEPALQAIFTHRVGDPGSYLSYGSDGAQVDSYCDGSLDASGPRQLPDFDPKVVPNPFSSSALPAPPQPDIMRSDTHSVLVGTGNSEGATFAIGNGATQTRVESTSLDVSAAAKLGYVKAGLSAGGTWGKDWSSSLSKGVEFESFVGHIPGDNSFLQDETYEWSSFLCQKTVQTPVGTLHPWVLDYTVDGYRGSGGLAPLSPVTVTAPKQSSDVGTLRPTLTWSQSTGTVQSYDWELEAVGKNDVQSGERTYTDPSTANKTRTRSHSVVPPRALLPGQLYRWRVTSTDFFGNSTGSDYEFFMTPSGPTTSFTASTLAVDAGSPVTFTNTSTGGSSYTWAFGDATSPVTQDSVTTTTHSFAAPGTYEVTLTGTNGYGTTTATRSILVGATVADDTFTGTEDTSLVVPAKGVLGNDNGATNPVLTSDPAHGLVTLRPDGSLTYVPAKDYCGPDAFAYSVQGATAPRSATVRLSLACVNDAPTAGADTLSTTEDTPVALGAPGVLSNDTDADGDQLLLTAATLTTDHGSAQLDNDGGLEYTPAKDYCGSDVVSYPLTDGKGGTTTGKVSVTVACVNDAPVARDDAATTTEGRAVSVPVLANDTDVEGGLLHVTDVSTPAHGTLTAGVGTSLQYTPAAKWCGTDTFTYGVADSEGAAATSGGTVTVTVQCVNDAPVAAPDTAETLEDAAVEVRVLDNDVDPDAGDVLKVTLPTAPSTGTAIVTGNLVRYTPRADTCGRQNFSYRVSDAAGLSSTATVTVEVECVNDPPVATPDTATAAEDVATELPVLANDRDVDGDPLVVTQASTPANGTTLVTQKGVSYTSRTDYCGPDSFTYTVSDGHGGTASASVTLTVTCVNDAPVAQGDSYVRRAGSKALAVDAPGVLANDTDVDTAPARLTAVVSSAPTSGTLSLSPTGGFTYKPTPSNQGGDSFYYRTYDGSTYSAPIRVVITVRQGK